ncbi:unnamed protein product [Adineta ricciae]|uniref:Uncharacterized protein n=1 Tax=Adineta ricciae TaxID=249248 RepID=A0A815HFQ5_ADIRI|nr:unnamed protein product [Adineta ricciae]CAF1351871.1 unnamed protein product [Adineta ricciae]
MHALTLISLAAVLCLALAHPHGDRRPELKPAHELLHRPDRKPGHGDHDSDSKEHGKHILFPGFWFGGHHGKPRPPRPSRPTRPPCTTRPKPTKPTKPTEGTTQQPTEPTEGPTQQPTEPEITTTEAIIVEVTTPEPEPQLVEETTAAE